jgi:hypothetical protein
VFEALEEALATATKKNNNIDAHVEIDRKTGEFSNCLCLSLTQYYC